MLIGHGMPVKNMIIGEYQMSNKERLLHRQLIEARSVLLKVTDALESELRGRYGPSIHPAVQSRFERDMEPVERARELILTQDIE